MNHVYRVIWNGSAACWQAVSETARGKSKSCKTASSRSNILKQLALASGITASLLTSSIALAVPTGAQFVSGSVGVSVNPTYTLIKQFSDKAIVNWNDFSIANGEIVNIEQPTVNSILLNRVVTSTPSVISGTLNANGRVVLVNPNGITFGSNAQLNVGSLIASTLDISDSDFNNDVYRFSSNSNNASIVNQGNISVANTGTAALIAPSIQQAGTIVNNDGTILLTAAADVTLSLTNRVLNAQTINAGHNTATINNSAGSIHADGGKVILSAQGVNSSSTASISSAGTIRAQTLAGNDRGAIDLISDMASGAVNLTGTLDASAPTNGFGGTIKTHAATVVVADSAAVTTRKVSQSNLPGTSSYWQIRTNNITVGAGGTISGSELSNSLNDGSVTLTSVGTGTNQGTININAAVSTNSNVILSLAAINDINFNNNVGLTANLGRLVLSYGAGKDYNLNNGSKITLSGSGATLRINSTDYTVVNSLGVAGDTTSTTLQGIKNNLTGNYALGSDIDASATSGWNSGTGFDPIGQITMQLNNGSITSGAAFTGSFHGLGHSVNSLNINKAGVFNPSNFSSITELTPTGLFSAASADLRDVSLANAAIKSIGFVGALVGYHQTGTIKNAHSSGNVEGAVAVGGLVGVTGDLPSVTTLNGKIVDSSSGANIKGMVYAGGLAGASLNPIYNSYATGNISLPDLFMSLEDEANIDPNYIGGFLSGGLVGVGRGIYNSHATGNIFKGTHVNGNWHSELGFYGGGGLAGAINIADTVHFVDNSYATGNVTALTGAGGLVSVTIVRNNYDPKLIIRNSYATGNVTGDKQVGGLVGGNAPGNTIENSYATGTVTGTENIGGLIGNNNGGIILNSYSTSNVTGVDAVGGLVGLQTGYEVGKVENSYSNGVVNGVTNVGGLIGRLDIGTVSNSYWDTTTSGQSTSAGGTGKTTAELKQIATFTGWNIADVSNTTSTSTWVINENNATPWLR